nr:aminotransferase class III-fold pyridoxal phosphate-dependent enzyme [uncultured Agathobaculum sp.]
MLQTLQSGTQRRAAVIAFKGSFHGRTMMCTSLTASNSAYRKHYEGLVPSIYFAEYPKLFGTPYKMEDEKCPKQYFTQFDDIFKRLVDPHSVAAILMEPVYRARAATLFRRVSGYGTCVTSATSMVSC